MTTDYWQKRLAHKERVLQDIDHALTGPGSRQVVEKGAPIIRKHRPEWAFEHYEQFLRDLNHLRAVILSDINAAVYYAALEREASAEAEEELHWEPRE